jgi:hypothetical protein
MEYLYGEMFLKQLCYVFFRETVFLYIRLMVPHDTQLLTTLLPIYSASILSFCSQLSNQDRGHHMSNS